ncbi:hypothetical protein DPMN_091121 [Dreissena polymorpha]|uniref:Uncharacterized protein n=1 Tax=Dreissena polymorpha TaxID=45954 RepID=A0A9D4L1I5_DREPO|nr:hypothetical protein DPMN_091121 [Dreissena polymorpha]
MFVSFGGDVGVDCGGGGDYYGCNCAGSSYGFRGCDGGRGGDACRDNGSCVSGGGNDGIL